MFVMNDDQLTELKQHLDQRFTQQDAKLDVRFAAQDQKDEDRLNQALATFAGAMNRRFDDLEHRLDQKADRADLERIYDALDAILKNQEIEQDERAAVIHQLGRHERWHHQTAAKVGLRLDYEES
jgi:hypothetical protein